MATTSYLYHCFGLIGYTHFKTEYKKGIVYNHVYRNRHKRSCRNCGAVWHKIVLAGSFIRIFIGLPIGRRKQYIVLHGHEQSCKQCGKVLREPIPFSRGKRRYIRALARLVTDLCSLMPIKSVAKYLDVGWDLVKDIYKEHLINKLKKRKFSQIRYIAIDEFAIRKGHHYMTIAMELETGEILFAAEGRDSKVLLPFFKKLNRSLCSLKAIAMDMWDPYMKAIRNIFGSKVDIVHDPYHVVTHANKAIDEIRRDIVNRLEGEERKLIKGTRYLLLKGFEKLNDSSVERLFLLMELNTPLYAAYLLKEDLRMFWNCPDIEEGKDFLRLWTQQANKTGLGPMIKLAKMLNRHLPGLLSYFEHRISTGPIEGLNNKIKTLKRQAYGFRDNEYFKLRLYFLHESIATFTG